MTRLQRTMLALIPWAYAAGGVVLALGTLAGAVVVRDPVATGLALAGGLVGGCWVVAAWPYRASPLAHRRLVALTGVAVLLGAGSFPLRLDQAGAATFVGGVALFLAIGWLITVATSSSILVRSEKLLTPKMAALQLAVAEAGLAKRLARADRSSRSELADAQRRFREIRKARRHPWHPAAFEEAAEKVFAERSPAEREAAEAWLTERRENVRRHAPLSDAEMAKQVQLAEESLRLELRITELQGLRGVAFVRSVDAMRALTSAMRAAGPALLALAFLVLWTGLAMLVWVIDSQAWSGIGSEHARFGDFVYLAGSSIFGSTPPGIEARASGARMLVVGEVLAGATLLTTYLAAVWQLSPGESSAGEGSSDDLA